MAKDKGCCLFISLLVGFILFLASTKAAQANSTSKLLPNIIFILTDDQRLDDLDYMPHLKQLLSDEGVTFKNYFCSVSLCCPSRTSILRGQYAHNSGVYTNAGETGGFQTAHARGLENSTIATWLHDHGYITAFFGKYLNGYPGSLDPTYVPPGWDQWASPTDNRGYDQFNYQLNENGRLVDYGNKPEDYGTDVYAGKAIDFIKSCAEKEKPFFLYVAVFAPHAPATPAPRHEAMFADARVPRSPSYNESDVSQKPDFIKKLPLMSEALIARNDAHYARRLRSLQAVDEAIANICKTLEETKQLDDTYIVFSSDNGFHLGEHRMARGKMTAYEEDIHLPLIMRGPGVPHGKQVDWLAGNIDLAPTFAELAGIRAPSFVDGRSLVPLLKDESLLVANWRNVFLIEHWEETSLRRIRLNEAAQAAKSKQQLESPEHPSTATGGEDEPVPSVSPNVDSPEIASNKDRTGPFVSMDRLIEIAKSGRAEFLLIPEYQALRDQHSSYVEYVTDEREFYDLNNDLNELKNLAASSAKGFDATEHSLWLKRMKSESGSGVRRVESEYQSAAPTEQHK